MHYKKKQCDSTCPNFNKCISNECIKINEEIIRKELNKINVYDEYDLNDDDIFIKGPLNDEQRSYIRHVLRLSAKSEKRESTYSEKIMEGEK